jgi:hypothetical protein
MTALKCIMRYLHDTLNFGLLLRRSSIFEHVVYSDADWARCSDTHRSTFGFSVFLGDNLVSWSSNAEAGYQAVVNGVAETCWFRPLLMELDSPLSHITLIYCDNVSTVYLAFNPVQHQHMKHVEIDLDFVRDKVIIEKVCVLHILTSQFIDIFTKGLPSPLFSEFHFSLNICCG